LPTLNKAEEYSGSTVRQETLQVIGLKVEADVIKGLWDSGAGMLARGLQQDVSANNLANVNTTAFKEDRLNFKEVIDSRLLLDRGRGAASPENRLRSGFETRFSSGSLKTTGSPLDFAIDGPGFFVLETPDGDRYTRAGHFFVSPDGNLVNPDGLPVMGDSGRLQLGPGPVEMDADGRLSQNGNAVGTLRLVEFEDTSLLGKLGRGIFAPINEDVVPTTATSTQALQGMLENSNLQAVEQMVSMIEQEKMYTFAQRALSIQDTNLSRAVGELGRVGR
jgi:flagellar basal-body rod protein FlgF